MSLNGSSSVTVHRDTDCSVVWLVGDHDVSTVTALAETMAVAIALDDADLVVDLSSVEFIDAATIGAIIGAREFLRLRSRSLTLRAPSTCALRVLEVCGLADLVDLRAPGTTATGGVATRGAVADGDQVAQRSSATGHRGP